VTSRRLHRLGDLQLAILRVLWARGEATAAEVQSALAQERGLALTTISTMLQRLAAQGVVGHRADGRVHVYRARVGEADVRTSMVADLIQRVFRGDSTALVSHLVEAGEVDPAELGDLREAVKRRKARRAPGEKRDA
jgi:predicted transcriptional regulator